MGLSRGSKLAFTLATLLNGASAATAEVIQWKEVGGWNVSFYPGIEGCAASTVYEGGAFFLLGLGGTDTLYVEIFLAHEDWRSIERDKEYDVNVVFGNEAPWNLEMNGVELESIWGLKFRGLAQSEKAEAFVEEFMRKTKMSWTYEGNSLGVFNLRGSSRAFQEVVACTKSYRDAVNSTADPFSEPSNSRDPFE